MRVLVVLIFMLVGTGGLALAQDTATPTPSPTLTETASPFVYATIAPQMTGTPGQASRFDYVLTAGDVHIGNLLTWILFSIWGVWLFDKFYEAIRRR